MKPESEIIIPDRWEEQRREDNPVKLLYGTLKANTIRMFKDGALNIKSEATGKKQLVKAGEEIYSDKKGLGPKTSFNIDEELKKWEFENTIKQSGSQDMASQVFKVLPQQNLPVIGVALLVFILNVGVIALARRRQKKARQQWNVYAGYTR
jgi:hypothetical protein